MEHKAHQLKDTINALISTHGNTREHLLPILREIVKEFGFISDEAVTELSTIMHITPSDIYGVASFYSFLSTTKKGTNIIRVCQSISCTMAHKDVLVHALEKEINTPMGSTDDNGIFTLEYTNCLGMCDKGPAMMINSDIYTGVTPEQLPSILKKYRR